jgi:predicted DNA-binding ribbon-helix-helix protein
MGINTHGGRRSGSGRKKRAGYAQRSISLSDSAWRSVKRLATRRRKRGEKGVSATTLAGELIEHALLYFDLESQKFAALERIALERGSSIAELVQEAVTAFLNPRRQTAKA